MQFRTEVEIPNSIKKITKEDKIFSIGSCFATEISDLLQRGQLQVLNNPFGTIFNPLSILTAIKRLHHCQFYTEDELTTHQGQWISLDHHSQFDTPSIHQTLQKINREIEVGNRFLKETRWLIITYGSSFVYEFLPQNQWVANCHKIPQKYFQKKKLSSEEIKKCVTESIDLLNAICLPQLQILFTLSPVRHTKDGIVENQHSKARLLNALHEAIEDRQNCHYLPIYELMMDDLRDYRFYKEDMIHPTSQAVQYIFEKFAAAYLDDETQRFIEDNFRILQGLQHCPSDESNPKYQEFLSNLRKKIAIQQQKVTHPIFQ